MSPEGIRNVILRQLSMSDGGFHVAAICSVLGGLSLLLFFNISDLNGFTWDGKSSKMGSRFTIRKDRTKHYSVLIVKGKTTVLFGVNHIQISKTVTVIFLQMKSRK